MIDGEGPWTDAAASAIIPSMPDSPIRALLADDHAIVRAGIRQFLEQGGIEVIAEADDGEAAKTLIGQHRPDVAVLDIQMPRATGIDVTRWARSAAPGVGILVLTAYDDEPYVNAVIRAGANGYVLKTASPAAIVQAVRDVNEGKQVFDQVIQRRQRPPADEAALVEPLSERELEVLALARNGYTNKAIGAQLSISDRTVQGHLARVYEKLQAASRTEAVMKAITLGLIPPGLD